VITTGCANSLGSAEEPAAKAGLGFITRKAGEDEAEYCET
jgi:hypothetical protein